MEEGIPVTITPRNSDVLVFEKDGETVFTKNSVNVDNPGGDATEGSFEKVIDSFFTKYFTQALEIETIYHSMWRHLGQGLESQQYMKLNLSHQL